jgi:hypothetical protein
VTKGAAGSGCRLGAGFLPPETGGAGGSGETRQNATPGRAAEAIPAGPKPMPTLTASRRLAQERKNRSPMLAIEFSRRRYSGKPLVISAKAPHSFFPKKEPDRTGPGGKFA